MSYWKINPAIRQQIEELLGAHIFKVPKEAAIQQCAAEVADLRAEVAMLKVQRDAIRGELRTLAAIQMRQRNVTRLVLTKAEFRIAIDHEVEVSTPEPGVRIYELIRKPEVQEKPRIILNG